MLTSTAITPIVSTVHRTFPAQPETLAFMNFESEHRFVMGANYHGGEQVLNYPWDAVADPCDPMIPAYAPDDQLFYDFGYGYTFATRLVE